ncbi:anticodon-binding protein [Mycena polygramma]|nr:anticodon-binding protein [Mycena polygramma]
MPSERASRSREQRPGCPLPAHRGVFACSLSYPFKQGRPWRKNSRCGKHGTGHAAPKCVSSRYQPAMAEDLDFQLPERFDLKFRGEDLANPKSRLHFAGKWPFWLSPRQIMVIPVAVPYKEYASQVCGRLIKSVGPFADVDNGADTLPNKVRNGEIAKYNFILVVNEEEVKKQSVTPRNRDNIGIKGGDEMMRLDDIVTKLLAL